jgi:hypothetical protein
VDLPTGRNGDFPLRIRSPSSGSQSGVTVSAVPTENQNIVTNISEVLSAEALEAGIAGAVDRLSVYVWLGRSDVSWMKAGKQFGYDVIDTNIDLPPLTIAPETEQTENFLELPSSSTS